MVLVINGVSFVIIVVVAVMVVGVLGDSGTMVVITMIVAGVKVKW